MQDDEDRRLRHQIDGGERRDQPAPAECPPQPGGVEGAPLAWARVAAEAGAKYFNPAGILTALSGIGLVLTSDVYDWGDTFVSIGLGVVVVTALIGALVHRPGAEKMITALESGDRATAAAEGKRAGIWGAVTSALLIVALIVMVLKTGAN